MVKGIAHVCILSHDLEATRRFYCDGLGLAKGFDFIRDGERVGFYLKAGNGNYLEFFAADAGRGAESAVTHFCLEVDAIDDAAAQLRAAGYEITPKEMGADHSWQAWITDPDGVRIELHEYTPESCQLTGKDCTL